MNLKKTIAIISAFIMLENTIYAGVLGSQTISERATQISHGTFLYENKIMSDQSSVGQQSEYIAKYTPNKNTSVYVTNSNAIYGKRTPTQAAQYMKDNGLVPMLGINASYFSLSTGVPMGHVISDKRVLSSDSSVLNSIGFTADGQAFIAPLKVEVNLKTQYGSVGISNVNKYNVATLPFISLYNEDFGKETKNQVNALTLILDTGSQKLENGALLEATVSDMFTYDSSILIEEGKTVLLINVNGSYEYHYKLLNSLKVGEKVELECNFTQDERWENVEHAIGSQNEVLVKDSEVITEGFTKGAAPRTAVGVTETGDVIFYVIDGRQTGYSYGVQMKTLAKRMKELGCRDAINLDGGGSTQMVGVYPGADEMSVVNSPSDGTQRSVSSFIFLKNNQQPTGELNSLYVTPQQNKYLTGTKQKLSCVGLDTNFYKAPAEDVSYTVTGESVVEGDVITYLGNSKVYITATQDGVSTICENEVFDTPDTIKVYKDGKSVDKIVVEDGEEFKLSAKAFVGLSELIARPECFEFEVSSDIGTIQNNLFKASSKKTTDGMINVIAGKKVKQIPITVINNDNIFDDITDHWAEDMIITLASEKIVSGYQNGTKLSFLPDNNITRAEFCVILSRYLGLETDYDCSKMFSDEVPEWAKKAVDAMCAMGYVSGKTADDGKVIFAPNAKITRAEAATIIGRTLNSAQEGEELKFSDSDKIPTWAKSFVKMLVEKQILSGYQDNTIRPMSNITRAEAVTLIYKLS